MRTTLTRTINQHKQSLNSSLSCHNRSIHDNFRFDYVCEFNYSYDYDFLHVESFRIYYEYEFDYECDFLRGL